MTRLRRFWQQYRLRRNRVPYHLWREVVKRHSVLFTLTRREQHRLRTQTSLFLHRKTINGAGDFDVDDWIRVTIAAQACLLVLNLDLDYFDGWVEVIVYPAPFVVSRESTDELGLIHRQHQALGGESWSRGPVVLDWSAIDPQNKNDTVVHNVVLHEFAHKLDTLNGPADGLPPLHKEMKMQSWSHDFGKVFEKLQRDVESHRRTAIDSYAAVSPAEFFAVVTEYFFEAPRLLHSLYPDIYTELRCFYRQDPLSRMS